MTTVNDLNVDRSPKEEDVALIATGQDPFDPTRWMKISVIYDRDPATTPEDEEGLGTFIHGHPRYGLYGTQLRSGLNAEAYFEKEGIDPKTVLSLPVYLLDHSGLALSTKSFNDSWDSAQVGVIYVTSEQIEEEFEEDTPETRARATEILTAQIENINDYLSGNVYGFRSEEAPDPQGPWEVVEECWGFVGSDFADLDIISHLTAGEEALWIAAVGEPKAPVIAQATTTEDEQESSAVPKITEDSSDSRRPRP
jgi:hypothetical protein